MNSSPWVLRWDAACVGEAACWSSVGFIGISLLKHPREGRRAAGAWNDFVASETEIRPMANLGKLMLRRYDYIGAASKTFKLNLRRVADGRLFIEVFRLDLVEEFAELPHLVLLALGDFGVVAKPSPRPRPGPARRTGSGIRPQGQGNGVRGPGIDPHVVGKDQLRGEDRIEAPRRFPRAPRARAAPAGWKSSGHGSAAAAGRCPAGTWRWPRPPGHRSRSAGGVGCWFP